MAVKLGEKIKALRKQKGMTLDALADLAGMSKSYLWELENRDDASRLSTEKLLAIARSLSTDVSFFLEDEASEPEDRHLDREFFRSYEQMSPAAKAQLRLIAETFKKS